METIFKFMKVWTCCGLVFLTFFLIGAIGFAGAEYRFVSNAKTAPAKVIAVRQEISHSRRGSGYTYRPEISYVVPETGKTQEVWVSFSSNPSFYKVGDSVDVYYDPATPATAQLKAFWVIALPYIILAVAILAFTIFGFKAVKFAINPETFMESILRRSLRNIPPDELERIVKNVPRDTNGKIDVKKFQEYINSLKK